MRIDYDYDSKGFVFVKFLFPRFASINKYWQKGIVTFVVA